MHLAVDQAADGLRGFESLTTHMLKKIGSKWVVLSETTGRRFGSYDTKKDAEKRLRQIEFFKSKNKNFFRKTKMTRGIKEGRKGRQ